MYTFLHTSTPNAMPSPSRTPDAQVMASTSSSSPTVKTRVLIISDTHGKKPLEGEAAAKLDETGTPLQAYRHPLPEADVAIHCGDLTARSSVREFSATFETMSAISAPLKLVIPGNHDMAMDRAFWERFAPRLAYTLSPEKQDEYLQRPDVVRAVVDEAAQKGGVQVLEQGVHDFTLANGARLRLYASPMTPEYGQWGFQYPPGEHVFDIPQDVHIAVTHGPPHGVLDETIMRERAGCPVLFDAVARARPLIHCFGHIHEAWGAEVAGWRDVGGGGDGAVGRRFVADAVDPDRSVVIESAGGLQCLPGMPPEEVEERTAKVRKMYADKCRRLDVTADGEAPIKQGEQTLFVNAAIMNVSYRPTNAPWLVDVELPRAS